MRNSRGAKFCLGMFALPHTPSFPRYAALTLPFSCGDICRQQPSGRERPARRDAGGDSRHYRYRSYMTTIMGESPICVESRSFLGKLVSSRMASTYPRKCVPGNSG